MARPEDGVLCDCGHAGREHYLAMRYFGQERSNYVCRFGHQVGLVVVGPEKCDCWGFQPAEVAVDG